MSVWKSVVIALVMVSAVSAFANVSEAGHRQYYSSWSYYPSTTYYYSTYYYQPQQNSSGYNYHYCISYPAQPRYVYYYNPHSRVYWGRLDLEGKDGNVYSILKEEDRKEKLSDIPETAFPKPAAMPVIPDSTDGVTIEPIKTAPSLDLPAKESSHARED